MISVIQPLMVLLLVHKQDFWWNAPSVFTNDVIIDGSLDIQKIYIFI